jgi:hypothetical protein
MANSAPGGSDSREFCIGGSLRAGGAREEKERRWADLTVTSPS